MINSFRLEDIDAAMYRAEEKLMEESIRILRAKPGATEAEVALFKTTTKALLLSYRAYVIVEMNKIAKPARGGEA